MSWVVFMERDGVRYYSTQFARPGWTPDIAKARKYTSMSAAKQICTRYDAQGIEMVKP